MTDLGHFFQKLSIWIISCQNFEESDPNRYFFLNNDPNQCFYENMIQINDFAFFLFNSSEPFLLQVFGRPPFSLLEKGVLISEGKKGFIIPAIGQGILSVDFYPDDRALTSINEGDEDCFGNTIRQNQELDSLEYINKMLSLKWSLMEPKVRKERSLTSRIAVGIGAFDFIQGNIRDNFIEEEISKTRKLMREDALQTKKLTEVVNEVSIILENDYGELQLVKEKICLDKLKLKMFKIEQGLFNLVQSYLLELEALETKIVLKLPNSKISKMLIKICVENNGMENLNGCEDFYLYDGFTVQRKEIVYNDFGLIGQRFFIQYDLPVIEIIENTFELTTVPTPVKIEEGKYIFQKWDLPKNIGVMEQGKVIFDMENCKIRGGKTYFCDNSIIYENFQTQCPESIVQGNINAESCKFSIIKTVHDCIFNRNIRGNSVIIGHFHEPRIKISVESGIPSQTRKHNFYENRNVSIVELNDQISTIECKSTSLKHGGIIKNPSQIAVNITDIVKIDNYEPHLRLELGVKSSSGTEIVQKELVKIGEGFMERSSKSVEGHWWEFRNFSEKNKYNILISSIFALTILSCGGVLSTKCGRKNVLNVLRRIFTELFKKCRRTQKISNRSEEIGIKKLEPIKEESENKPRKLSITM